MITGLSLLPIHHGCHGQVIALLHVFFILAQEAGPVWVLPIYLMEGEKEGGRPCLGVAHLLMEGEKEGDDERQVGS